MPDLTFPTPEGFQPPENLDSDDTFQAMATFKVTGDGGQLQLIDVEGYQIGEEDTEGDTEAAAQADQANAAGAMQDSTGASDSTNSGPPQGLAAQMGAKFRKATGLR